MQNTFIVKSLQYAISNLGLSLVLVALIVCNYPLFDGVYLGQDPAATSIGAFEAGKFNRLYGTPSWNDYYHPGPIWMYVQAVFDQFYSWIKVDLTAAKAAFTAKIAIILISLGYVNFVFKKCFGYLLGGLVFMALLVWLVLKPEFLYSIWEPHVGAMVFIAFIVMLAHATSRLNDVNGAHFLGLGAGLVGVFLFQIQLSFFCGFVILSLAFGYFSLSTLSMIRALKVIGCYVAGAAIGLLPILVDILFRQSANLFAYFEYSRRLAPSGNLSWNKAMEVFSMNGLPTIGGLTLMLGLLLVSFTSLNKNEVRENSCQQGQNDDNIFFKSLLTYSFFGFVSAFVFYWLFAKNGYAPLHSGAYSYTSLGLFFSVLVGIHFLWVKNQRRLFIVLILLLVVLVSVLKSSPPSVSINGIGYFRSLEFGKLIDGIKQSQNPVSISVKFLDAKEASVAVGRQREMPWSVSIGLANELRRANVNFCYKRIDRGFDTSYADRIMTRFMDTDFCSDEDKKRNFELFCDKGSLNIYSEGTLHKISEC
jgi:hypothetical protein